MSILTTVLLVAAACGGASTSPGTNPTSVPDVLRVPKEGWRTDFARHTVPLRGFTAGGPGKDGIPAIDHPSFESAEEAVGVLDAREPVIELELGDLARAYPLRILVWHEIVNDEIAGTPVVVTFCPLCNTALVFDRRLGDRVLSSFGTTGNLRNSDLVMYDRDTETWWQQFGGEAVVGELAGRELAQIPSRIVAFEDFAKRHPNGQVLSSDTGFSRPYGQNPYTGYDDVDAGPLFPASNSGDRRLPPKARVVFLDRGGRALAVPFSLIEERGRIEVEIAGETLDIAWVPGVRSALDNAEIAKGREVGSATVSDAAGTPVAFDVPFWFAVAAFRPDVTVLTR